MTHQVPWAEKLMAKHASGRHEFESECVKVTVTLPPARVPTDPTEAPAAAAAIREGSAVTCGHGTEPPQSSFQCYKPP